jgi:hypothetical protein
MYLVDQVTKQANVIASVMDKVIASVKEKVIAFVMDNVILNSVKIKI